MIKDLKEQTRELMFRRPKDFFLRNSCCVCGKVPKEVWAAFEGEIQKDYNRLIHAYCSEKCFWTSVFKNYERILECQ